MADAAAPAPPAALQPCTPGYPRSDINMTDGCVKNVVNMIPKTPEMLNDNDYVKNNMDDKNNSYNVDEQSRDATSLPRRRHVAVTSLTRH